MVVFDVGERQLLTPASSVRRFAPAATIDDSWIRESPLGTAAGLGRGLVVAGAEGESTLAVDGIRGIRSVPPEAIHPLPPIAAAMVMGGIVRGVAEIDEELLLLVDLFAVVAAARAKNSMKRERS